MEHMEKLNLTTEWDKTFPKSDKVDHKKVTFLNRFGITLAADLYTPKGTSGKLAALAVCGPFGAVKEQSSGIYAQTMAERGFITLAVDPAYTGESGGWPRNVQSPDICTEDFGAAVDFLSVQEHPARVGREVAADHVEERRLAGAVRADEGGHPADRGGQGHVVERAERPEALRDALHPKFDGPDDPGVAI